VSTTWPASWARSEIAPVTSASNPRSPSPKSPSPPNASTSAGGGSGGLSTRRRWYAKRRAGLLDRADRGDHDPLQLERAGDVGGERQGFAGRRRSLQCGQLAGGIVADQQALDLDAV
jgi:hypothetical protein